MLEKGWTPSEIKKMTIDEVDLMCIALDEWRAAEVRARGR